MSNTKENSSQPNKSVTSSERGISNETTVEIKETAKKGPLSFLSGALTSLLLGWISFILSEKVVIYFSTHSLEYSSSIATSIASGFKTLVIGMTFLATFTFLFIGIGLTIVFIRSLFAAKGVQVD